MVLLSKDVSKLFGWEKVREEWLEAEAEGADSRFELNSTKARSKSVSCLAQQRCVFQERFLSAQLSRDYQDPFLWIS